MTARTPVEFVNTSQKRVGNRIIVTDDNGELINQANPFDVTLPGPAFDAFGRQRVSTPFTLFDSKQLVDNQPLFWDDAAVSGAGTSSTYNANQASTTIAVSNVTTGMRVRQTFRRFNYQPGKSQLVFMTGVLGAGAAGVVRRIGTFDAQNGLFFQLSGNVLSVVHRTFTSGVAADNAVAQSDWNLDTLDGHGPSGLTLDVTKTQIFVIDFEWLGVGRIRFGFNINGNTVYCHEVYNANVLTVVYMSTPNLPLRYEISNDGSGPAASLVHICSSISSEGGVERNGFELSADRGATALTTLNDADLYPLLAIRLKSTHLGATIQPNSISVICASTTDFRWAILLNPTVAGTALNFASIANSAIEVAAGATNATKVTGGVQLKSGYSRGTAQGGNDIIIAMPDFLSIGSKIDGTRDILVLAAQRLTGATETFYAAMGWREIL